MTETAQELVARLGRTLTTMMNDDLSEVRTEKRTRHIERTGAVHDAAEWIEAAAAREAALTKERDEFRACLSTALGREMALRDALSHYSCRCSEPRPE